MTTVIAAFVIFALALLALSLGVVFSNKPIQGSCGGLNNQCGGCSRPCKSKKEF